VTIADAPGGPELDLKLAEQIGRSFNSAFNSANLYGGAHPTTIENVLPLHQNCIKAVDKINLLTLSVERESVFVENFCIDKVVNTRRIAGYFKKAGIQSMTFEKGIQLEEMKALIRTLGDFRESPSVKAIQDKLAADNAIHIRINYVSYRKVTADEAVIGKQEVTAAPFIDPLPPPPARTPTKAAAPGSDADAGEVLAELEPVMTIHQLLKDSNLSLENLKTAPSRKEKEGAAFLAGQLKNLSAQIGGTASEGFSSAQEMMEAVVKLRQDVTRSIDVLKAAGRLSDAENPVAGELEALARETVIRLIRDEYQQGAVSVKRLAQVIRRILPDVKELKKILPALKACLLGDGMSMADYLELVNSLVRELEDEGLTQSLTGAAEEMGVSVEELMQGIKSDPADAARLIVLASEIRKGTSANTDQLSSMLAEYVERVSRTLTPTTKDKAGNQAAMRTFETQLLEKIKAQGVGDPVVERVKQRLSHEKGGYELPKGVFDMKVTTFFLDHEIKRNARYHSPFSVLVLSMISVKRPDGTESAATTEETGHLMPAILLELRKMLRDLDWVGVEGWISENVPFVILPMTDEQGAKAVKDRVGAALNKSMAKAALSGEIPHVIVTTLAFDGTKTPDTKSFLNSIMELHKKEIEKGQRL
jgi:hypothetical protein